MGNPRTSQPIRGDFAVILLDTHVIFELIRPHPEPRLLARADGLDPKAVAITAMTEADNLHGLARMPDGRRKQNLQQSWDALMAEVFTGRVWPFTSAAAHWTAQLLRRREQLGRSMATADAVIAATALAQGASLATRDVADFADIGLEVINPWDLP
ncbi:MAG: type II toxin-antitoxin system VapC family toxin [Cyanobacteria bacterium]|nr:type II toxin-antitoxin system VapC family toxin [Cyanobacteriota bacterium]